MSNRNAIGEASKESSHRETVVDKVTPQETSSQEPRGGCGTQEELKALLKASRIAVRRGDLDEAQRILREAVMANPRCIEAWTQLAWLARDRHERRSLLRQVLALEPEHVQAQAELARDLPLRRNGTPNIRTEGGRILGWALVVMALAVGVLAVAFLVWWPVDAVASTSPAGSLEWLADITTLPLLASSTPAPTSTPQATPGQVAARFEPQLDTALSRQDWDRALEIVAIMRSVDPAGDRVRRWALTTSMRYGQALVATGQAKEALNQFEVAVALAPGDAEADRWQQSTQLYLAGQEAFEAGRWEDAIASFTLVQDQMPNYADLPAPLTESYRRQGQAALAEGDWTTAIQAFNRVHEQVPDDGEVVGLLASSFRLRGIARQEQGALKQGGIDLKVLEAAKSDLEAALALRPDDAEAMTHLEQVDYMLHPPKRIEVDISEQRLYAWQGDTLVYEFPVSTGLPGQDTATGHYEILDRIPMAYSRIWDLNMPYWMGIYWVQGIENGFHALPIRPDGSVMWAGLLGRRASYGCIVLGTEAAKTIYNWAEIGTAVDIYN